MANICITIAGENLDDVLNDLADFGFAASTYIAEKAEFEAGFGDSESVDSETCADCGGPLDEPVRDSGYYRVILDGAEEPDIAFYSQIENVWYLAGNSNGVPDDQVVGVGPQVEF
jgi:hypothetical protein